MLRLRSAQETPAATKTTKKTVVVGVLSNNLEKAFYKLQEMLRLRSAQETPAATKSHF